MLGFFAPRLGILPIPSRILPRVELPPDTSFGSVPFSGVIFLFWLVVMLNGLLPNPLLLL
jgi:hypothetical protein